MSLRFPQTLGTLPRTCVATQSSLELVQPLGFKITDKALKRAGLDYWPHLKIKIYKSLASWLEEQDPEKLWMFSAKGGRSLYSADFSPGDRLVFGKETKGLPKEFLKKYKTLKIPFGGPVRSLNLSNAVAVALYEALRQNAI